MEKDVEINELKREVMDTIREEGLAPSRTSALRFRQPNRAARRAISKGMGRNKATVEKGAELPMIPPGLSLTEMTQLTMDAIAQKRSSRFVILNGKLARVLDSDGRVQLECYSPSSFRAAVDSVIRFQRKIRDCFSVRHPPLEVLDALLHAESYPDAIPRVDSVITGPVITQDGEVIAMSGLCPEERMYVTMPPGASGIPIPEAAITNDEIALAREEILAAFVDFPFKSEVDKVNLVALIIVAVCRHHIDGVVPLFVIDGNRPGIGKGLMLSLVHIIAYLIDCGFSPSRQTEDELRKRILALLLEGRPFHIIDNLDRKLNSTALTTFITAETYCDRRLGSSETVTLKNRSTNAVTGNRIQIDGDLLRRCVLIQLHSDAPDPSRRSDFRFTDVKKHVKEHRNEILRAVFILVAAYIRAGRPLPQRVAPMGSFEHFRDFVGGVIENAGFDAVPFSNIGLLAERDQGAEEHGLVLIRAYEKYGNDPFSANDLAGCLDPNEFPIEIPDGGKSATVTQRLGIWLSHKVDTPNAAAGLVLRECSRKANTRQYKVEEIG